MLPRIALIGLALCMIVMGCASLSKEECTNANWDAIGYGDGSHGRPASRFNTHQKACAEHGFKADFKKYKDGHQRGLREVFCKPRNGYHLGLRGAGYDNVCPSNLEHKFLQAYRYGRDIDKMQRSCNHLGQQITWLKNDLATVDERITTLRRDDENDDLSDPSKSIQDLRNQRRKATELYERIKGTRQKGNQINIFKGHLRHESNDQHQRYERDVKRIIQKSVLSASERQAVRKIIRLSVEKGHLKSEVNWIRSNPNRTRPRRRDTVILKRQLSDLSYKIDELKKQQYHHQFSREDKRRLDHCFEQAEYEGILQHHRQTAAHLRAPYALGLLIDVHFDAEMENLNQRIDFARHHAPTKEELAIRKKRRHDLREAQRQQNDYLTRIDDMERKIVNMRQKMEHMKSVSPY